MKVADCIMCRTCRHPPHIRPVVGKGYNLVNVSIDPADATVKNKAGDARNSFLRRAFFSMPELCVACREDVAFIVGFDHDLFITASFAQNRFYGTIAKDAIPISRRFLYEPAKKVDCLRECHIIKPSSEQKFSHKEVAEFLSKSVHAKLDENQKPTTGVFRNFYHSPPGCATAL